MLYKNTFFVYYSLTLPHCVIFEHFDGDWVGAGGVFVRKYYGLLVKQPITSVKFKKTMNTEFKKTYPNPCLYPDCKIKVMSNSPPWAIDLIANLEPDC